MPIESPVGLICGTHVQKPVVTQKGMLPWAQLAGSQSLLSMHCSLAAIAEISNCRLDIEDLT